MKITIETETYERAAIIVENIPADQLREGDILRIQLPERVIEYVYRANWTLNLYQQQPAQNQ